MKEGAIPPLETSGLSVVLGGQRVLRDVTLSVAPGEFVALVGPNGSGKTTLLRAALGMIPLDGDVRLYGRDVRGLRPRERARLASWVPQQEVPADNLPVVDFVTLGRYPHQGSFAPSRPEDFSAVEEALREADVDPFRNRGVLDLSGGERQRVLFARALAQRAPLLLLDEPTSHLDMAHQLEIMDHLRRYVRRSRDHAVVASVHDLNLASRFADRILWLSEGRLVSAGPPGETITSDLVYRVFGVWAEVHRRGDRAFVFPRLDSGPGKDLPVTGRPQVHVVGGGGSAEALLERLVPMGYPVTAGVLHLLDSDAETCGRLRIPAAFEAPFSPLSAEARERNRKMMRAADLIILAPFSVGEGNLGNLEDPLELLRAGGTVWTLAGPSLPERDFTGGRASQLYRSLIAHGAREFQRMEDLLQAIAEFAPEAGGGTRRDGPLEGRLLPPGPVRSS